MTTTARQWSIFFAYTAYSVVTVLVLLPLGVLQFLGVRLPESMGAHPVATTLLLVQMAVGGWSSWRTMHAWSRSEAPTVHGRWDLPRLGFLRSDRSLYAVAVLSGVIAVAMLLAGTDSRLLIASLTLLIGVAGLCVPWWIGALAAFALGVGAVTLGAPLPAIAIGFSFGLASVTTVRGTLWLAAVVRELEDARQAQAQLAVAEERLRFARDLHDVTGRDLSVIAVKSELVAQLAERGDARAVEHGREAAQIARASLAEIRALVRGYREADLATELRGTASLLRSAHVEVTINGSAEVVPAARAGTAAWVLREGGTNILRHADPTGVTITLTDRGVTLVNDGATGDGDVREGSGLTGMRERLGPHAALRTHREDGTFTLDVRFDAQEGTS
ncbi:histidine kinase [Brachybacterium sp. P6-10-X1]|uniref:sensor histidine kinase n=1 Tax=Brachybacterium sp. P6-10-X1 TaxID=1903186 RepID=UPI000971BF06|nr:histidine kinase [Brachybacterium sp. P6-10-X1]APX33806.1 histidine kinase [Brachybacterium sp. P6-10-X1]